MAAIGAVRAGVDAWRRHLHEEAACIKPGRAEAVMESAMVAGIGFPGERCQPEPGSMDIRVAKHKDAMPGLIARVLETFMFNGRSVNRGRKRDPVTKAQLRFPAGMANTRKP